MPADRREFRAELQRARGWVRAVDLPRAVLHRAITASCPVCLDAADALTMERIPCAGRHAVCSDCLEGLRGASVEVQCPVCRERSPAVAEFIAGKLAALLAAAAAGEDAALRALVQRGADPAEADRHGRTALLLASEHGHEATVRFQ